MSRETYYKVCYAGIYRSEALVYILIPTIYCILQREESIYIATIKIFAGETFAVRIKMENLRDSSFTMNA